MLRAQAAAFAPHRSARSSSSACRWWPRVCSPGSLHSACTMRPFWWALLVTSWNPLSNQLFLGQLGETGVQYALRIFAHISHIFFSIVDFFSTYFCAYFVPALFLWICSSLLQASLRIFPPLTRFSRIYPPFLAVFFLIRCFAFFLYIFPFWT